MSSIFRKMDSEFDEEEAEFEAEYGELLDEVTGLIMEEDSKIALLNTKQTAKVEKIHDLMQKELQDGCTAALDYKLNEPFKSMGSIHLEGKHIIFNHPQNFVEALKYASNVEIYPKTDGTVHLAYTVHGLTTPIG